MCWHKRHSPVAVHKIKVIDSLTFIIFHEAEYFEDAEYVEDQPPWSPLVKSVLCAKHYYGPRPATRYLQINLAANKLATTTY